MSDPARRRFGAEAATVLGAPRHAFALVALTALAGVAQNALLRAAGLDHLIYRSVVNCVLVWVFFLGAARLLIAVAQARAPRLAQLSPDEAAATRGQPPEVTPGEGGAEAGRAGLELARGIAELAGAFAEADLLGLILAGVALVLAGLVALGFFLPWLWLEVPALLLEAAFQVALSASLVRRAGRVVPVGEAGGPGWLRVLAGGTLVPWILVTTAVVGVAAAAHFACGAPARLAGCFDAP